MQLVLAFKKLFPSGSELKTPKGLKSASAGRRSRARRAGRAASRDNAAFACCHRVENCSAPPPPPSWKRGLRSAVQSRNAGLLCPHVSICSFVLPSEFRYISSKRYDCNSRILWGISVPTVPSEALPTRNCPRRHSDPWPRHGRRAAPHRTALHAPPSARSGRSPKAPPGGARAWQPKALGCGRGKPGGLRPSDGGAPCGSDTSLIGTSAPGGA